ncbi:hypothetical protein AGMMS50267_09970 [Spirochaetia bacterium]|nr:hypothetical protein AGMMS50267_09970 [Spirochaetia bacterium]
MKTRIFTHGNDEGAALLWAVALIVMLSLVFVSFVPRVIGAQKFASQYKASVLREIQETNKEISNRYDVN